MLKRIQDEILREKIENVLQKENTHEAIILRDILQRGFTTVRDLLPKMNCPYSAIRDLQNVFSIPNIIGNKFHPTEKPVELMKIFIEQSTEEGDIVLEPFCGAGATCVAAKELGRGYVAAELEKRFCDITEQRLQGVAKREDKNSSPEQQSLF